MRESYIEQTLRNGIKQQGGWCLKWVSPGTAGVPDRICILPGGIVAFVELKAPGKKIAPGGLQEFWQRELHHLGQRAYVVTTPQEARNLADYLGQQSRAVTAEPFPRKPGKATAAAIREAQNDNDL